MSGRVAFIGAGPCGPCDTCTLLVEKWLAMMEHGTVRATTCNLHGRIFIGWGTAFAMCLRLDGQDPDPVLEGYEPWRVGPAAGPGEAAAAVDAMVALGADQLWRADTPVGLRARALLLAVGPLSGPVFEEYRSAGVGTLGEAEDWHEHDFPPVEAGEWVAVGFSFALAAKRLREMGYTPSSAAVWAEHHITNPTHVRQFTALGLSAEQAAEMVTSDRAVFVRRAALPLERAWGALVDVACPTFARAGWEQGQDPGAVARLARATAREVPQTENMRGMDLTLHDVRVESVWDTPRSNRLTSYARSLAGLDWAGVAACIETGMTMEAAREYGRGGGDFDTVLVMAALLA